MNVKFVIYNHSGTIIKNLEVELDIAPRVGEIVVLNKMDNTTEFIVTDILHHPLDNCVEIRCESFYRDKGGYTRCFYLRQAEWLQPCPDLRE